jgi:hypothetical protein
MESISLRMMVEADDNILDRVKERAQYSSDFERHGA